MMALAAPMLPISVAHSSGEMDCVPIWPFNTHRARLPEEAPPTALSRTAVSVDEPVLDVVGNAADALLRRVRAPDETTMWAGSQPGPRGLRA